MPPEDQRAAAANAPSACVEAGGALAMTDGEFGQFQRFIYEAAGISLSRAKKAMVTARLALRVQMCRARSYGDYLRLLMSGESPEELQTAVDLLTTNETYFFREPKHFEFLKSIVTEGARRRSGFRVWSAAGSSGEEAYSIAMLLEDCMPGESWEVMASDISTRMLARARSGHYSTARTDGIPPAYLRRFCLSGRGAQEGTLLIDRPLRNKVRFLQVNLNKSLPALGQFDVIFLRNVLIYFDPDTKRQVVRRVLGQLKPGGWLFVGHTETLAGICDTLERQSPAIYRKPV
ncbi:MAG TPA: CheR family methyltransferase [Steroidobacteraceae bacterium]|nr:CheR family methyltransferase [Steroidobacteraceae bacterium]